MTLSNCEPSLPGGRIYNSQRRHLVLRSTALLCALALLVSCDVGGNGAASSSSTYDKTAARLVGVQGLKWSTALDSGYKSGVTDSIGRFDFMQAASGCGFVTENGWVYACPGTITSNVTMSLCGISYPSLVMQNRVYFSHPRFTEWEYSSDPNVSANITAVELMGNSNPGDPLLNGILISPQLQNGRCSSSIDWSTQDIQKDAAELQTLAQADGLPHPWPTAEQIQTYSTKKYECTHAGIYTGRHVLPRPAGGVYAGQAAMVLDTQGNLNADLNFYTDEAPAPFSGSTILFSGGLAVGPGGGGYTYTVPPPSSLAGLTVNVTLFPDDTATTAYRSSDGAVMGTTDQFDSQYFGTDIPGMSQGLSIRYMEFPVYRFIVQGLNYAAPGASQIETYALQVDIGADGIAKAELAQFPLSGPSESTPPYSDFYLSGSLKGNTLTLSYSQLSISTPMSQAPVTLAFDPNALTLTGEFSGYEGTHIATFTSAYPLQGCALPGIH